MPVNEEIRKLRKELNDLRKELKFERELILAINGGRRWVADYRTSEIVRSLKTKINTVKYKLNQLKKEKAND